MIVLESSDWKITSLSDRGLPLGRSAVTPWASEVKFKKGGW